MRCKTAPITTDRAATISAYSTAVAPDSSSANRANNFRTGITARFVPIQLVHTGEFSLESIPQFYVGARRKGPLMVEKRLKKLRQHRLKSGHWRPSNPATWLGNRPVPKHQQGHRENILFPSGLTGRKQCAHRINHVPPSYSPSSPQRPGSQIRAIFRHTAPLAIVGSGVG